MTAAVASVEDHAVGIELQLIELVEQRERARAQGRGADLAAAEREIQELVLELMDLMDRPGTPGRRVVIRA